MIWLNVLALASAAIGFRTLWVAFRRMRTPPECPGAALLSWQENPHTALQEDAILGVAHFLHVTGILTMAALLILGVNRSSTGLVPPAYFTGEIRAIWYISLAGGVALAAYTVGIELAFFFARRRMRPVLVQVIPEGIIYGGMTYGWAQMSHFCVDPLARRVRFYAKASPELTLLLLRPPRTEVFDRLREAAISHLPDAPAGWSPSWHRGRLGLAVGLVGVTAVFVLFSLWAFLRSATMAQHTGGLVVFTLYLLGGWIVRSRFTLRPGSAAGKGGEARSE